MNIMEKIKKGYYNFTKKQQKIADYFLNNPEDICYITLSQLSKNTNISEVTLLKFCKKLDCNNFLELKDKFRKYTQVLIKDLSSSNYLKPKKEEVSSQNSKKNVLQEICFNEAITISKYYSEINLENIIEASKDIKKSRKIFIFAHDISKILGEFLESRLKLLAFDVILIDLANQDKTQYYIQRMRKEDTAIFFAFPKYFYFLKVIVKEIIKKEGVIISITDSLEAPTVEYSKHILLCKTSTKLFYNSLSIPMILLNLLASYLVLEVIDDSEREEFLEATYSIL